MKPLYILIGMAVLLFASCGQQHEAKSVVKVFMSEQLHKDVSYLDFTDVDSTHFFTDSLVQALRQRAPQGIQYQQWNDRILLHIRAQYLEGNDTCSATFYLDRNATGVVAFKMNGDGVD